MAVDLLANNPDPMSVVLSTKACEGLTPEDMSDPLKGGTRCDARDAGAGEPWDDVKEVVLPGTAAAEMGAIGVGRVNICVGTGGRRAPMGMEEAVRTSLSVAVPKTLVAEPVGARLSCVLASISRLLASYEHRRHTTRIRGLASLMLHAPMVLSSCRDLPP